MTVVRVIDFETTGMEPPAEVCEVGICDLRLEDRKVDPPSSWLCGVKAMPPEGRAIHHIILSECEGRPPFDAATLGAPDVAAFAAHNSDFETKFFRPSLPMICTYKSALRVWPTAPGHGNNVLRYWLEDQGLVSLDRAMTQPAHRAAPDAYVTAHLLMALFAAGATGKDMVAWTKEPPFMPTCPIGKFRGMPWADVEAGFLGWMLRQPTMEDDLKWNAQREIARRSGG